MKKAKTTSIICSLLVIITVAVVWLVPYVNEKTKEEVYPFGLFIDPMLMGINDLERLNNIIGQDISGVQFLALDDETELVKELIGFISEKEKMEISEDKVIPSYDEDSDRWFIKINDGELYLIINASTGKLLFYVKGDKLAHEANDQLDDFILYLDILHYSEEELKALQPLSIFDSIDFQCSKKEIPDEETAYVVALELWHRYSKKTFKEPESFTMQFSERHNAWFINLRGRNVLMAVVDAENAELIALLEI